MWAHTRQITLHGALTVCLSSTYIIYSKCNSHRKHTASENYSCKTTNTKQTRLQAWNHFSWGVIIITHQSPRRNAMLWKSQCKTSLSVTYTKTHFTLSDFHSFLSHIYLKKNPQQCIPCSNVSVLWPVLCLHWFPTAFYYEASIFKIICNGSAVFSGVRTSVSLIQQLKKETTPPKQNQKRSHQRYCYDTLLQSNFLASQNDLPNSKGKRKAQCIQSC